MLFSVCLFVSLWWRPGFPGLGFLFLVEPRGPFSAVLENGFSRRRSTKQVFQILEILPLLALALFVVVVCVLSQSGGYMALAGSSVWPRAAPLGVAS